MNLAISQTLSTLILRISLSILVICAVIAGCQSCVYEPLGIDTDDPYVEAIEDVIRDTAEEIIENYTGYDIELPDF